MINLGYVPLFLNILTNQQYGVWLTFLTILNWFAFFDIGLGNGLRNKLGIAIASGNYLLARKYLSTVYACLSIMFFSLFLFFFLANNFINWNRILNTNQISASELYSLTLVVMFFFCLRFIVQIIQVVYFSLHLSFFNNLLDTLGSLISFLILFGFKYFNIKPNLTLVGTIVSSVPVLLFIFSSILAYNYKYQYLRPSFFLIDFSLAKDLMGLGLKFFIMQISAIVMFSTSNIFITQFYGPEEVSRFNICFKLFQVPVMINSIIMTPVWSAVTEAYFKQDFIWLKSSLKKLNFISLGLAAGVVILAAISPFILKFWVKNRISVSYQLIFFISLYSIVNIFNSIFSNFINGLGKLYLTTFFCFFGIVIYFVTSFIFRSLFSNASGIILSMTLASLISLVLQAIQTNKLINSKAKGIWFR